MALNALTIIEIRSTATAGNVNGGGFNPANANMLANLACDANTGNTDSPVVSSASYTFVAGDVGAKLFIKSGTNWNPGWYIIVSVSGGKATVNAAIGAVDVMTSRVMGVNTFVGIATVGTPTSGTFTIDYSQKDAAVLALTDFANASNTTLTTATGGFTPAMRGNLVNIASGTNALAGWYEITNTASSTSATIDRTCSTGGNMSSGVGKVGGAMSLGSGDDTLFNAYNVNSSTGTPIFYIRGAVTYTTSAMIYIQPGNSAYPQEVIGYLSVRSDNPSETNRPTIASGTATAFSMNPASNISNLIIVSASSSGSIIETSNVHAVKNCKIVNKSATAGAYGISSQGLGNVFVGNEIICYRGYGVYHDSASRETDIIGCYIHDSNYGVYNADTAKIVDTIIEGCVTAAIHVAGNTQAPLVLNSTLYGAENKLGLGFVPTGTGEAACFLNNIIYGFVTGINAAGASRALTEMFNCFFNNTTNETTNPLSTTDLLVNPQFKNVSQLTGTTATTSGSVLTQSGADFSNVVDGRDYLYLVSGTGITAGVYGIVSHTTTTLVLDIAPGTNATANKVWQITLGHDFSIGTNLKAKGFMGAFPGALTTGYTDIGAVQRAEQGSASFISG